MHARWQRVQACMRVGPVWHRAAQVGPGEGRRAPACHLSGPWRSQEDGHKEQTGSPSTAAELYWDRTSTPSFSVVGSRVHRTLPRRDPPPVHGGHALPLETGSAATTRALGPTCGASNAPRLLQPRESPPGPRPGPLPGSTVASSRPDVGSPHGRGPASSESLALPAPFLQGLGRDPDFLALERRGPAGVPGEGERWGRAPRRP